MKLTILDDSSKDRGVEFALEYHEDDATNVTIVARDSDGIKWNVGCFSAENGKVDLKLYAYLPVEFFEIVEDREDAIRVHYER